MKTLILSAFAMVATGLSVNAQSVEGKKIFTGNCQVCHSIGAGDVVGPDLAGVTERRDAEWIRSFITNSQKMVAAGDEQAVAVFNKYNKVPMPPHNFSDEELNHLISYMAEAGEEANAEETEPKASAPSETPENAEAAVALNSGLSWYLNGLVGLLGVIAVILCITAGYLYRLVKN